MTGKNGGGWRRLPETRTAAELEALLGKVYTTSTTGLRNRALLQVLAGAGLWVSEVVNLRGVDVDLEAGTLPVNLGKGGKDRVVPVDGATRGWLAAWAERRKALGFVRELVRDCYCPDNGRPSWDPLVLFKVVFLQFLYDLSDRQVEEQVNQHLACKWFVDLQPEEAGPDHSTLCRFRNRLGPEKFQAIFNRIVAQARQAGLERRLA